MKVGRRTRSPSLAMLRRIAQVREMREHGLAHEMAVIEVSEQPHRVGPSWYQIRNQTDAWLQDFEAAAITVAVIELLQRIH
jgi:hypothetical protein